MMLIITVLKNMFFLPVECSDYFMYHRHMSFDFAFINIHNEMKVLTGMFPFVTGIMFLNITLRTSAETKYIDRCEYQCKKNAA